MQFTKISFTGKYPKQPLRQTHNLLLCLFILFLKMNVIFFCYQVSRKIICTRNAATLSKAETPQGQICNEFPMQIKGQIGVTHQAGPLK